MALCGRRVVTRREIGTVESVMEVSPWACLGVPDGAGESVGSLSSTSVVCEPLLLDRDIKR